MTRAISSIYRQARLAVEATYKPLATADDGPSWDSETQVAPWVIYVLTKGEYDGQFLFINDKANARVAVIDLRDFSTKQIIKNPNTTSDHGGAFVTPNTEYVIEGPQYGLPIGSEYATLDQYKDKYRGLITFWKFDRPKGRIDPAQSFQIELPPYWQDLCDAGKGVSEGWLFCNSFNTELATGGIELGNPPFEAGTTKNDTDYLHIIDRKKAEQVVNAGGAQDVSGIAMISLQTAIDEGILRRTAFRVAGVARRGPQRRQGPPAAADCRPAAEEAVAADPVLQRPRAGP